MNIIVTRPAEDSAPLAIKLEALGHCVSVIPLLSIVVRPAVSIPEKCYQAICLTSANGVRSLHSIAGFEDCPVITVGPQSLSAAVRAGFRNTLAQGGDVVGLASFVTEHYDPQHGPLLYISGFETSGDLEGRLTVAGFQVDRLVTYDAVPTHLSNCVNEIEQAEAVMLFSPRSAKLWQSEIVRMGLEKAAGKINHYCLSANVAAALPQSWPKIIAEDPTEPSILAALE